MFPQQCVLVCHRLNDPVIKYSSMQSPIWPVYSPLTSIQKVPSHQIFSNTRLADMAVEFRPALCPRIVKVSHVEAECLELNKYALLYNFHSY